MMIKSLNALGVYGGASLNSVELALLATDGLDVQKFIKTAVIPYPEHLVLKIRALIEHRGWNFEDLQNDADVQSTREQMSDFYAEICQDFAAGENVDCIGIDGLTIVSDPQNHCSYQLEDGHYISAKLKKQIITHFHKADLLSGGQASPLSPAFFYILAIDQPKPLLFIDIETITSLIYIGESGEFTAFDCAPGTAMIEDWTFRHANMQTDYNGKLAITGKPDPQIISLMLKHKILHKEPPKSIDLMCFRDKKEHLEGLSLEDGAATATAFLSEAIYQAALDFLPAVPQNIFCTGEGCKNPSLVRFIKQNFAPRTVRFVTDIQSQLTAVGAQSTAFNTVRRLYGLPITYPKTTGAYEPITGGEFYENF